MLFSAEAITFLLSSLLTLGLTLLGFPIFTLVKILAVLLLVLIFALHKFYFSRSRPLPTNTVKQGLIFLTCLIVQLAVFSSGGFYSPFIVVFHLYALGVGFLTTLANSILFLVFSVGIMLASIFLDQNNLLAFQNDPWSTVLYLASFVVIVPIINLLVSNYKLKDSIYKILVVQVADKEKQIQLEERRKSSILESLSELVIVTDSELRILSVNESVKKTLRLTNQEILQNNIFDVVLLRDREGNMATPEKILVEKAKKEKKLQSVEGFYLFSTNTAKPDLVTIQVNPTYDLGGNLDQLTFLIGTQGSVKQSEPSFDIDKARAKYEASLALFKKKLASSNASNLASQIELVSKTEKDIFTVMELLHEGLKPTFTLRNLDRFCEQILFSEKTFAQGLGVEVVFGAVGEKKYKFIPSPFLIAPIDVKWLEIMIAKIIEMAVILSSEKNNSSVALNVNYDNQYKNIDIVVAFPFRELSNSEKADLFREYYGSLGSHTKLSYGSGLEGFLIKTIATQLHIPVALEYNYSLNLSRFVIRLYRKVV